MKIRLGRRSTPGGALVLAAALLLSMFAGAGQAQADATITVAITDDIRTLDPANITFAPEYQVAINLYNGLVRYSRDKYEIIPDLAQKWTFSQDGKTLTFNLRKGVRWHRGFGEVSADDVVFTFKRHMDPATKSAYRGDFADVESVEAVDRYTVKIVFKQPSPAWLRTTAAYRGGLILNRKAVTLLGADYALNPVGTGPFKLEQYVRGSRIVLGANDSYYAGKPKLRQVVFVPIAQEPVAQLALESGQIDILYARTAESPKRFQNRPGFTVQTASQFGLRSVFLNTRRKPFDSKQVRAAVSHAINKKSIEEVLGGTGLAADNPLPPGFLGYTESITRYPYDPARAKQLLAEAGYPNGFETSLLYANIAGYREVVPVIQANLAEVGIRVRLEGRDGATARSIMNQGNYDMVFQGLGRPPDPDLQLGHALHTKNFPPIGFNLSYYAGVDDLLDRARIELDERRRAQLYSQVQQKATADAATIPIYYTNVVLIMRDYVKGHLIARNNDFWMYDTYIQK